MDEKMKNLIVSIVYKEKGIEGAIKELIRDEKDAREGTIKKLGGNFTEYDFGITRETAYIDVLQNMLVIKSLIRNGKDLEEVLTRIEKHCQNIREIAKKEGVL